MELKSDRKLLPNGLEEKLENNNNNMHYSPSNRKTNDELRTEDWKLPVMISRRTPRHSPNASLGASRDILSRREESLPVKRCFSKVLELSRHQIIVTKQSNVGISMIPPKRIRLHDFNYASNHACSRSRHKDVRSSPTSKRKEELKRLKPSIRKLPLPSSQDKFRKSKAQHRNPQATVLKKNSNTSHFLVSVENFPQDEWRENNYDAEMLREIIFLSEANATPVTLVQKDNQVVVKFENIKDAPVISRISSGASSTVAMNVLKSPFTFTLNVISGVIRWIVGD